MGMVTGLAILGAATTFSAHPIPSAVLVTPRGGPIGGQEQRWINEMKVPTIPGSLTLESSSAMCVDGATGCSAGAPAAWYPGHFATQPAIAASTRTSLYFELGHQFDFYYLTWPKRSYLAWFWRARGKPWVDSQQSIVAGGEDGLEADFAYTYQECAYGITNFDPNGFVMAGPTWAQPPQIHPRNTWGTCAFIDRIAT